MGVAYTNNANSLYNSSYFRQGSKYPILCRIARKKNAPKIITSEIEKIKKRENSLKEFKVNFTKWKNNTFVLNGKTTTIKDIVQLYRKKEGYRRRKEFIIRRSKAQCCDKLNIAPVILVEKKVID